MTTGGAGTVPTGGPEQIFIQYQTFTSDTSWPADLILDRRKSNWLEWDRRLNMIADQQCFTKYLNGTLPCPDPAVYAQSARNWKRSDRALRGFILEHISERDYETASVHAISHDLYIALCTVHQNQGIHAQVRIMKEALDTRFSPNVPLSQTLDKLKRLHKHFVAMGRLDDDKLMIIYIMNALGDNPSYNALQSTINGMLENTSLTSLDVENKVLQEEDLITFCEKDNALPKNTALAAVTNKWERPICANCKQPGHHTEYCIKAGGQMAGKTLEEARAAQSAARTLQKSCNNCGNTTPAPSQANTADGSTLVMINGKCYILDNTAQVVTETNSALAALTMEDYDQNEYIAVLAISDTPVASLDWRSNSRPSTDTTYTPVAYTVGRSPIAYPNELPFILDTGATCHISPEASDFKVLKSIPNHPVKGLSGSAVYVTGIGDIKLHVASGHKLKLSNVLYVPESRVHLVSILALNKSSDYTTHFDSTGCWVTNKSNTTIVRSSLSTSKRLYILSTKVQAVQHFKSPPPFPCSFFRHMSHT